MERASRNHRPDYLGRWKGGYFVTEVDEAVSGLGREKGSGRDPDAANDVTIPDYVMLDFVDEFFASQKNERHRTVTEP